MAREEKKKLFSKQNMVSLFIVFIMVSSVIGYMWGKDTGESFKYKDYKFFRKGREWTLKADGIELAFDNFPTDVESINVSSDIIDRLKGLIEIDTTCDENDSHTEVIAKAQYSMWDVLSKTSNTYVRVGMIDENEFNLPVITCDDASADIPVLYFKRSNMTEVETEDNCIIIEAKNEIDVLRVKDRILYGLLGII